MGTEKGPHWTKRALQLIDYISKLSRIPLPADRETIVRDRLLLTLGAFLSGAPLRMGEVGKDLSFIVNTTVKYLVDGVRAREALPNAQKQFSEMAFSSGLYNVRTHFLDSAVSLALRHVVDNLCQDFKTRTPDSWVDAGFPVPPDCSAHGMVLDRQHPIIPSYRQWSYGSSGTAFSGDAATSFSGAVPSHSPKNETSLKAAVRNLSSPSRHD